MNYLTSCLFFLLLFPTFVFPSFRAGVGKESITPPLGTPSAGYAERKGEGMVGSHDPLLAIALFIDNGTKQIIFCSVDHLGFTYKMTEKIIQKIHSYPELRACEIFIGSSHTHSGGGAYFNIPVIGTHLAGAYNSEVTQFYIDQTVKAILDAYHNQTPAKVGIGYGKTGVLSQYRGTWPKEAFPLQDVAVIKVTHLDNSPLAVLFNYPVHPTVLNAKNLLFSSDFVGYARDHLQSSLGATTCALYFNGAQGDILPIIVNENDRFDACSFLGKSLADTVKKIWDKTATHDCLQVETQKESYTFKPKATSFGLELPLDSYKSEINVIVFNGSDAFITIPGELSSLYDQRLKSFGKKLGFCHVSVFGLTNDAHGYIILPESWRHKTMESGFSFGGENYGDLIEKRVETLLQTVCKPST